MDEAPAPPLTTAPANRDDSSLKFWDQWLYIWANTHSGKNSIVVSIVRFSKAVTFMGVVIKVIKSTGRITGIKTNLSKLLSKNKCNYCK